VSQSDATPAQAVTSCSADKPLAICIEIVFCCYITRSFWPPK